MPDAFLGLDEPSEDSIPLTKEFEINRSVYNEIQFSNKFLKKEVPEPTSKLRSCMKSYECSRQNLWAFVCTMFPILNWLPKYRLKTDLVRDIAGGITVGIMHIPQGMAYGMLTSLPAIYGLYVSFVPVLVYFFLGTSRHISLGTFAIVCLMSGEAIESTVGKYNPVAGSLAQNGTDLSVESYRVEVAVSLSFAVGVVQLLLGIIRMGFLTIYLSDPLVSGFTTGAAFHILSSQVRHFLGLTVPSGTNSGVFALFKLYIYFFEHIKEVNVSALVIGAICTIILFVLKYLNQKYKFRFPIPAELIVVVLGAGISYGAKFHQRFDTPILKSVPKGFPALTTPKPDLMVKMATEAITIAIVAFAINVSLVKSFAKKNNYTTDSNQELVAYGLANIISSFFSCSPSAASLSRSLIQESLGSTQITGFIAVVFVGLVLVSMAPLFQPLPNAVLAAIVLVALKGLFKQFAVLKTLWKISKIDAFVWFASFLAVFCLGVDYGLAIGIVVALLSVVGRTSRPSFSILGRIPNSEIYKSIDKYAAIEIPGVKIFQYKSSLYYANIEHFQSMLSLHTSDLEKPEENLMIKKFSSNGIENSAVFIAGGEVQNDSFKMESYEKRNGEPANGDAEKSVVRRSNSATLAVSPQSQEMKTTEKWQVVNKDNVKSIVLDLSRCGFIDSMVVTTLGNIVTDRQKSNIEVYLTNCSENVLDMLGAGGFMTIHGKSRIFLTVHDAVIHCLSGHDLKNNFLSSSSTPIEDGSTDLSDEEVKVSSSNGTRSSSNLSV